MRSPYDLITVTEGDLEAFECDAETSKIGTLIQLVLDDAPSKLKPFIRFVNPYLKSIYGFEDCRVKGYRVVIDENKAVEKYVRSFIPFFILRKEKQE